jgi:hypothetical protein
MSDETTYDVTPGDGYRQALDDCMRVPPREWRAIQGLLRALVIRALEDHKAVGVAFSVDHSAGEVVLSDYEMASALQDGLMVAIDYADGRTVDGGVRLRLYREVDPNQGAQPIQG